MSIDVRQDTLDTGSFRSMNEQGDHMKTKESSFDTSPIRKQKEISPLLKPIILFLLGALLSVAHHFVNNYADGRPLNSIAIPQIWMSRIGTGLAFAFKSALSVSVSFVLCQLMWLTLRRKFLTFAEIDQVYQTANQDVMTTFFSSSILKSPLLVFIVAVSLLLPITTVFTPSSLRVDFYVSEFPIPCQVPTGNLTNGGREVSLYASGGVSNHENWSGLRPLARKLAYPTMVAQEILPLPSPQQCNGLNCTYSVSFLSVVYQCQEGVELPAGLAGDDIGRPRTYWNATANLNSPISFYAYWYSDNEFGTKGSALCTAKKAQYDFTINIRGGKQTVEHNTTQIGELDPSGGSVSGSDRFYERMYEFQLVSVANVIQTLFLGAISVSSSPGGTSTQLDSQAISAAFFNNTVSNTGNEFTWGDVPRGIEQLSHNVSAAILAMDLGFKDSSCIFSGQDVVYKYDRLNLWLPYGVALLIISLSLTLGITVFFKLNTENLTASFSDTVRITRNSSLNIPGRDDGTTNDEQKSALLRFRLGELKDGDSGFGTHGELKQE